MTSSYLDADLAQLIIDRMRGDRPKKRHRHPRLPRAKREKVFTRDGNTCRSCGTTDRLTIDHIVPLSRGGNSHMGNLQTLCLDCNAAKADR